MKGLTLHKNKVNTACRLLSPYAMGTFKTGLRKGIKNRAVFFKDLI